MRLLGGDALHDVLAHVLGRIELRLLRQVADAGALGDPALAVQVLVDAGHDAQQRRFARAVDAEHADLGVGIEGQMDVVEDLLAARIGLGEAVHVIDELTGHGKALLKTDRLKGVGCQLAGAACRGKAGKRWTMRSRTACGFILATFGVRG